MKNSIKYSLVAFVIGFSLSCFAQDNTSSSYASHNSSNDQQVGVTARLLNATVYFKLLMKNETKDGIYSLVRRYSDGSFEYVGHKNIVPNDIDTPLLYCLKDTEIPSDDFTYVLYRITSDSEVVAT